MSNLERSISELAKNGKINKSVSEMITKKLRALAPEEVNQVSGGACFLLSPSGAIRLPKGQGVEGDVGGRVVC